MSREESREEQRKVLYYMKDNPDPISILELWAVEEMQDFFKEEHVLRRRIRIMADKGNDLVVGVGRITVWTSETDSQKRSVARFKITEKGLDWLKKYGNDTFEEDLGPLEIERRRVSAAHNEIDVLIRNFTYPYTRRASV